MHRLPHTAPVKFVEKILHDSEFEARTVVRFPYAPTLPMIVEAAAQTSAFVGVNTIKRSLGIPEDDTAKGMLLKMKATPNRKMHGLDCQIHVVYVSNLDHFFVMRFELFEDAECVCEGEMNIYLDGPDDE